VSAVPEDFMRHPADPPQRDPAPDAARRQADQEPATAFWQWVAVGVFVVCWLAEAAFCAARAS
jgi:hypothetical protein